MSWEKEVAEIEERRQRAKAHGGAEAVARQHEKGRLTIRERIAALADPDSFEEIGEGTGEPDYDAEGRLVGFTPANYVLGFLKLAGRRVVVGGEDFTIRGGSPNAPGLRKSVYAEEAAIAYRLPLVRLHEGGGGSVAGPKGGPGRSSPAVRGLPDPVTATPRFLSIAQVLGVAPVASAALGPVAGLPAARLVASHFAVMCRNAQVLVAGPAVVERALGVSATKEDLGSVEIHAKSGVADNIAEDEADAFAQIRRFLSYLPDNVWSPPPVHAPTDDPERRDAFLLEAVPRERRRPFDMRRILAGVLDQGSLFEMTRRFGPSLITALARLDGHPVGVIANDCRYYAGAMTAEAAQKLRRFADLCNTFALPVVSFVDEPGFMIGPEAERAGTIRHGVAAIAAVMQSRVPWASVIVHKVFGVAGAAHFGPGGFVLAWPSAETGALPVEGGIAVAFKREIENAPDPDAKRRELEAAFVSARNPFPRAEAFAVHELIDPRETRPRLVRWLHWTAAQRALISGPFAATLRA